MGDGIPLELQKLIVGALNSVGARQPCPRCGHQHFSLMNRFHVAGLQDSHEGQVFQGVGLPTIVIHCQKCGWLAEHALYVLMPELRPQEKPKEGGQEKAQ